MGGAKPQKAEMHDFALRITHIDPLIPHKPIIITFVIGFARSSHILSDFQSLPYLSPHYVFTLSSDLCEFHDRDQGKLGEGRAPP